MKIKKEFHSAVLEHRRDPFTFMLQATFDSAYEGYKEQYEMLYPPVPTGRRCYALLRLFQSLFQTDH